MRRFTRYILMSLLFTTLLYGAAWAGTPGSLSVSVSSQRGVMDAGQNNTVSAVVTGGNGNYTCAWSYYPLNRPSDVSGFANQSCTVIFHGNSSDLASPDVIVADANDVLGDTGSGQAYVAVKPGLTLSITPSATTIYAENSISISNSTANDTSGVQFTGSEPYTFYYIIPGTGVTEEGNGFFFTAPGTYEITEVVNDNNGATASASTSITVLPLTPTVLVGISAPYSTIEVGQEDPVSAQATGGLPPYSYAWFVNGVLNTSSTSNAFSFSPAAASTYLIYAQATDQEGTTNSSQDLSVQVVPAPLVSLYAKPSLISAGQSVIFTNSTTGGIAPYTYSYTENNPEGIVQQGNTLTFADAGNYIVTLKVSDAAGGTSESSTMITVTPQLKTKINSNTVLISAGQSVDFWNATSGGTGSISNSYTSNSYAGVSQSGNVFTFNSPGNYMVTLTTADFSGETSVSDALITVTPQLEVVSFTANDASIYAGQSVAFSNTISGGTGSDTYSYTVNDMSGVSQSGSVFTFGDAGNYLVTLTVKDISGETASASALVTVSQKAPQGCTGNNSGPAVQVTGSSKTETVYITDQSAVYITGSSNKVAIYMPGGNCNIAVVVTGSSNNVGVYNGTISLTVTGSSNAASLYNTVVSEQAVTGSSNRVSGAILEGNSFTITGSSDLVESVEAESLGSLDITGSGANVTVQMLGSNPLGIIITGSSNVVRLTGGTVSLKITGSSNYFYYHDATVTSEAVTGSGNKITED